MSLTAGCKDTPSQEAAKEARRELDKAIEIIELYTIEDGYNYQLARNQLEKALNAAARADMKADAVFLSAGDLNKAYAVKLSRELASIENNAPKKMDMVGKELSSLQYLLMKKKLHTSLGQADKTELENLLAVVNGTDSSAGLIKRLEMSRNQLRQMQTEYKNLQEQIENTRQKATDMALKADKMFREAEKLSGDEKIKLQRKAYNIIRGIDQSGNETKGTLDYELELQNLIDQARMAESDINALSPVVEKMERDLEDLNQRIAVLKDPDMDLKVMKHIASLDGQISEKQQLIKDAANEIRQDIQAYNDAVNSAAGAYDDAISDYRKVKAYDLRDFALLDIAISYNEKASLLAKLAEYNSRAEAYAGNYTKIATDEILAIFESLNTETAAAADEALSMTNQTYAQAAEQYESAIDMFSGDMAARAVRSYMLMISDMINLEKRTTGDKSAIDFLIEKVEQYKQIAIEEDEYFSRSVVARQFSEFGLEFKTAQEKLLDEYSRLSRLVSETEAMPQQEDRKAELMSILENLAQMQRPSEASVYESLIEKIFTSLKPELKLIREENPELPGLDIFIPRLQEEEQAEALTAEGEESGEAAPGGEFGGFGGPDTAPGFGE
ncbi:hypothetical protein [Limihaloglobus sulfuriphilus]|nr:hypothetical protein [Limihaloglobus sulfuriphilus]